MEYYLNERIFKHVSSDFFNVVTIGGYYTEKRYSWIWKLLDYII